MFVLAIQAVMRKVREDRLSQILFVFSDSGCGKEGQRRHRLNPILFVLSIEAVIRKAKETLS